VFGVEAEVTPGKIGQFDVLVNGKLLFSKQNQGRFPEEQEILAALPVDV
jgi:selT/selW/selH-like putative selenoprotein